MYCFYFEMSFVFVYSQILDAKGNLTGHGNSLFISDIVSELTY